MSEYIAIFQIGPVQEYINNAKKTQDFWSGSYILSYLSAVAIESAEIAMPGCVIYPFFREDYPLFKEDYMISVVKGRPEKPREHDFSSIQGKHIGTLPNRFVAVHEDRNKIFAVLKNADKNVADAYKEIVRQVKDRLRSGLESAKCRIDDEVWNSIWERQNRSFFKSMWVIYDRKNDQKNKYGEDYKLAERLFGARKGIRDFDQIPDGEPGKKCTLCGERQSLDKLIWDAIRNCKQDNTQNILNKIQHSLRKNERLCTSCTVKRLAPEIFFEAKSGAKIPLIFPSTSTVAVSPSLCRLIDKWDDLEVTKKVQDFCNTVKELNLESSRHLPPLPYVRKLMETNISYPNNKEILRWEGDLFIEDTYQKKILSDDYKMPEETLPKKINLCREALKNLMADFQPSKYYAVIMMDGDDMGKHLEDCLEKEDHIALSKSLGSFAKNVVPRIAESFFSAKVAYFGGDEGVIFVGLDDLIGLMRCLRAAFSGQIIINKEGCEVTFALEGKEYIRDNERDRDYPTLGKGKTACIAAVIAHHQQSLLQVMEILRNTLENKAKKVEGKDAFCITLMKRSGGTTYSTGKWVYNNIDVIAHLEKMVNLYREKSLTWKWLYDLDREKIGLGTGERVYAEIIRLLRRHSQMDEEGFQAKIEPVFNELKLIYSEMFPEMFPKMREKMLENFINFEFTANYIAKGGGN